MTNYDLDTWMHVAFQIMKKDQRITLDDLNGLSLEDLIIELNDL